LDTSDLYLLQTNITTLYPDFDLDNFFYCADMGVKSGYRGQGVASLLYQERLKRLQQNNQKYLLVRTTKKTDKPYEWYRKL
jgi:ribosomal protein S18 acetylase RimI-like enzyme